eukprot:6020234-Pyramimonas_sp.AAC.1
MGDLMPMGHVSTAGTLRTALHYYCHKHYTSSGAYQVGRIAIGQDGAHLSTIKLGHNLQTRMSLIPRHTLYNPYYLMAMFSTPICLNDFCLYVYGESSLSLKRRCSPMISA